MSPLPRLHVVTDDTVLSERGFIERAGEVLSAGGDGVALHVRGPRSAGRFLYEACERLAAAAAGCGALLVVNDRVDVALALGWPAVQLGARSLAPADAIVLLPEGARIGVSVRDGSQARSAAAAGASWLVVGTIWESASHPARPPAGVGVVRDAAAARLPVIGVGGVTADRVPALLGAGAHGAMVLRAVWRAPRPGSATARLVAALSEAA